MIKPEYILLREKKDGVVFSSMTVEVPTEFDKFLKDRNFVLRCSESSYSPETDIEYKNKVYKTKQWETFKCFYKKRKCEKNKKKIGSFSRKQIDNKKQCWHKKREVYKW